MRKILIVSHSMLAEGMKETLQFFAGNNIDVNAICAYVDEESIQSKLDAFFAQVKKEDEVLIFTDLLGGSVNQAMLAYIHIPHVHLITGVFLGIILELLFKSEDYLTEEEIKETLEKSKKGIVYMNTYQINTDDIEA